MIKYFCLILIVLTGCTATPAIPNPTDSPPSDEIITATESHSQSTSTSIPTPISIPQTFAIIDGMNGFLIGGSQDGNWLNADTTAPYVLDGEEYRLLNSTEKIGVGMGMKAETIADGPCTQNYTVGYSSELDVNPNLLVGGRWDVTPRTFTRIPSTQDYKEAVKNLLIDNQVLDPMVMIAYVYEGDLEGDGENEILIIAINFEGGKISPSVKAGNYSLIALRKIIDGVVVTIPLVLDVYLEDKDLAYPMFYLIEGIFDLNGDGQLDIVVEGSGWEKRSIFVYDVNLQDVAKVLEVSCAQ